MSVLSISIVSSNIEVESTLEYRLLLNILSVSSIREA
jgi:hypothetical protein